jgi:DeoR/GlpR family transcriptional regulator of sugar metabolism
MLVTGEERREVLLAFLRKRETASVDDLADRLGVSRMTVHRDLDRLAELSMVRKIRGGATLLPTTLFEADYAYRERQNRSAKSLIAATIAAEIEPGMAVMLDDSSTTANLAPLIVEKAPLTVITNGMPLIETLHGRPGITLIALGGSYDPIADGFFGLLCEIAVARLRADLVVFSTAAVEGTSAFLHSEDIARGKLAMKAAAKRSVIGFDATKFGKPALNLFCPLREFDEVIISDLEDAEQVEVLRRDGVRLRLISTTSLDEERSPA